MAWLDERVWCHPKFSDLSDRAGWTWTRGIAYSSGMLTGGVLTPGQQRMIGADAKTRRELIYAGLWHEVGDGSVEIHDWDEHNGKRDKRRAADRDRKRNVRNVSAGASAGQSAGASTGTARVDGSEGSDGSEEVQDQELSKAVDVLHYDTAQVVDIRTPIDHALEEAS